MTIQPWEIELNGHIIVGAENDVGYAEEYVPFLAAKQMLASVYAALEEANNRVAALNEQAARGDRQLIELRRRVAGLEALLPPAQAPLSPAHSGVKVYNYEEG